MHTLNLVELLSSVSLRIVLADSVKLISSFSARRPDELLDVLQLFGQDPQFARTMTSLDLSRLPKLDDPSMVRQPLPICC